MRTAGALAISLLVAVLGSALPAWAVSGPFPVPFPTSTFQQTASLTDTIQLFWSVDEKAATILVGIASLQKPSWLGVGFSDNGGMTGAGIAVGRVAGNVASSLGSGSTPGFVIEDRHATGFVEPQMDIAPTLSPVFGFQNETMTAFVFNRPLTARCHFEDVTISLSRAQWVIFAHGTTNEFAFHGDNRGQKQLFLGTPKVEFDNNLPADTQKINIVSPPVTVPSNETTMYCYSLHELPSDKPYHIVREEPIITSPRAHHLILYICSGDSQIARAKTMFANESVRCVSYSKPDQKEVGINPCSTFYVGWALGGGTMDMPKDVGRPMGKGSAVIGILEMHLDNSKGDPDTVDASGINLYYTPTLRPMDMGVLPLGVIYQQMKIPPGQDAYTLSSVCPDLCTKQMRGAVTIHGSLLHMHTNGFAMRTRIIRNGKEVEPIAQRHYDSRFQAMVIEDGRQTIEPGDTIVTECTWNTVGKNQTVRGGLATSEEMCFNFLNVYPATNLYLCLTTSDATNLAICPTSAGFGISGGMAGAAAANSTAPAGGFKIAPQRLPAVWTPYDNSTEDCPAIYLLKNDTVTTKPSSAAKIGNGMGVVGLLAAVAAAVILA